MSRQCLSDLGRNLGDVRGATETVSYLPTPHSPTGWDSLSRRVRADGRMGPRSRHWRPGMPRTGHGRPSTPDAQPCSGTTCLQKRRGQVSDKVSERERGEGGRNAGWKTEKESGGRERER